MEHLLKSERLSKQDITSLTQAGLLWGGSGRDQLISLSDSIVNALPKQWGGEANSHQINSQIANKLARHTTFLQRLEEANLLQQCKPETVRVLLENGEKVAALAALLEVDEAGAEPCVREAASSAGRLLRASDKASFISDRELFYASPGNSVVMFLQSAQKEAQRLRQQSPNHTQRLLELTSLAQALLVALHGAKQQHAWQLQSFPHSARKVVEVSWMYATECRAALYSLATELTWTLRELGSNGQAGTETKAGSRVLLEVAGVLLGAFAAAHSSSSTARLGEEYASVREELLGALLVEALQFEARGDEEGAALMSSVQSLAEAHLAYTQIFDITQAKQEPELLYDYMLDLGADNPAAGDTMATYTFARLFSEGRVGELLDLPSQFDQSLQLWLQNQKVTPEVMRAQWMHALRMRDFQLAAAILRKSRNHPQANCSVQSASRLACLSKLATLASQPPTSQLSVEDEKHLEEDNGALTLLEAQKRLRLEDSTCASGDALLAEANRETDSQLAFTVLAAAGSAFREEHRSQWAEALTTSLTHTPWTALAQNLRDLPQQQANELLLRTPLAQAFAIGYAPDRHQKPIIVDGRFEDSTAEEEALDLLLAHAPDGTDIVSTIRAVILAGKAH